MTPEELEAQRLLDLANTPPTNPPVPPPTDPIRTETPPNPLNALYEQAYLEQVRKTQELEARLNAPLPAPTTPTATNDEYWNNPAEFIRSTIQRELRETIKPFQQNLEVDSRQRKYQEAKALIRNSIPYFNQIESEVDTVMTSSNLDPTPQNLQLAISIVLGARQMNNRPLTLDSTPSPTSTPQPVIPPNLPPSAPPPPVPHPVNQVAPLTELERRIARERNMTDEEYTYYRDAPNDITSIKSYQESKAGAK